MDWKFIMCLLVMCSTTIWKLLEILTYGEIQVRQVDDVMTLYMEEMSNMEIISRKTEEKIATTSDKQKGE